MDTVKFLFIFIYLDLLNTKNLKTFESIFKIFEKLLIYFGILEKFN